MTAKDFAAAVRIIGGDKDWLPENIRRVAQRQIELGGSDESFFTAVVQIEEENQQHNHPTESEKPVAQQAIAYEQCNGDAGVSPQRDMRRMNQTFEALKKTMKSTDTDPDEVHFVKIVSQEMDGDAVSTKFDTYESDCVHTRP